MEKLTHQAEHLTIALSAAVPLHREEIRQRSDEWLLAEASRCSTVVASKGDVLQFGGKGSAECFNALARGLACAALVAEGGVTWLGQHWCKDVACHTHP